jgi:hypothetical protein
MKNALILFVVGVWLALAAALGSFVIDNLPPFPTCAGLGGGCTSN